MLASKCVSLGGTCSGLGDRSSCNTNLKHFEFRSKLMFKIIIKTDVDDPRTLKSTDKVSSCYDSRIKLNCTGTLVRSKDNLEKDATPKKCISLKGTCCSSFGKFFDPRKSPNETYCIECYSGPVSNGSCGGKLLATIDYTAKTCTYFGGSCCDDFNGIQQDFFSIVFISVFNVFLCYYTQQNQGAQLSVQGVSPILRLWNATSVTVVRLKLSADAFSFFQQMSIGIF